jgi:hypothetical protein
MLALGAALAVLVFFLVGPTGGGEVQRVAMAMPVQDGKALSEQETGAPSSKHAQVGSQRALREEPETFDSATPRSDANVGSADAEVVAPKKVGVLVTSQPPGAEIFIDGASRGLTPSTLFFENLEKRDIKVTLRKDLHVEKSVVLPLGPELAGQTVVLSESLERRRVARPIKVSDPFKDL